MIVDKKSVSVPRQFKYGCSCRLEDTTENFIPSNGFLRREYGNCNQNRDNMDKMNMNIFLALLSGMKLGWFLLEIRGPGFARELCCPEWSLHFILMIKYRFR